MVEDPKKAQREEKAMRLMEAYQRGDRRAFDGLVALLGPSVYRFFTADPRTRNAADDLYQETWLKVHHARHTYRPGRRVLPWLFGIARHVAADHRRHAARHQRRVDAVSAAHHADEEAQSRRTGAGHRRVEAAQLLARALETLPERQREALWLLKVEGLSVVEAAAVAGTTPGALKVRAHRAYAKVRALLDGLEDPDEGEAP